MTTHLPGLPSPGEDDPAGLPVQPELDPNLPATPREEDAGDLGPSEHPHKDNPKV